MDKKFRILVAGCGAISNEWLSVMPGREDCDIVALVDMFPALAEKQKEKYHIDAPVYADFDTALAETKPEIVVARPITKST